MKNAAVASLTLAMLIISGVAGYLAGASNTHATTVTEEMQGNTVECDTATSCSGAYTIVGGDAWGALVLLHFDVVAPS